MPESPRTGQSAAECSNSTTTALRSAPPKVRFALAEKGLAWESRYLDILAFTPEFLKLNPKAMVPVLVHDGRVITESTLICEYVETVFAQLPIYPRDPYATYQARLWTKAVDEDLHPACSAITYVVSHRHTILRNGVASFEDFLKAPSKESVEARKLKWQWIQKGLNAPGAADRIRLYDRYLHKMEDALAERAWLAGGEFSIADIALTPYVNRLAMLGMSDMWTSGRLPRVEDWFSRVQARDTFETALIDWIPSDLRDELMANGRKSWPDVQRILQAAWRCQGYRVAPPPQTR